jgi:hypothetical protein
MTSEDRPKVNERIRHSIYREGIIKSIRPGSRGIKLSIQFDSGITKTFIYPHPTIECLGVGTTESPRTQRTTIRQERQPWVPRDSQDGHLDELKKRKKQERLEKYRESTTQQLSISQCRRILNRLKYGSVPTEGVKQITFGRDQLLKVLEKKFENTSQSKSEGIFIQGYYGEGKSHLLSFLYEIAMHHDFAVSYVSADGYTCALNHPQRFYRYITEGLSLPGEEHHGLHNLFRHWRDSVEEKVLRNWAERTESVLGRIVWNLFCYGKRNANTWERNMKVLRGHDIYKTSSPSARKKAIDRLSSLGLLIRSMGYSGLVLLFDEVESIHTLLPNVRSRNGAYELLSTFLNENVIPHCFSVFAVTPDFGEGIERDLERYAVQDSRGHADHFKALAFSKSAQEFLQSWSRGEVPLRELKPWHLSSALKMAMKVTEIHGIGREWDSKRYVKEDRLRNLCEHHLSREYSERSLVKAVVNYLDFFEQKNSRS